MRFYCFFINFCLKNIKIIILAQHKVFMSNINVFKTNSK